MYAYNLDFSILVKLFRTGSASCAIARTFKVEIKIGL
ncbi:hypothetical protein ES703_52328 [subsurface metagenome]